MHASDVVVLNPCLPLPFPVAEEAQVDERLRLQYRYIDLRRPRMARNLVLRHKVVKFIRDFLSDDGFIEIETPILANPTPEGARDYLVPSRLHPGSFYALPQSPQQFKQLSMVAGVDRYFQIARCFRDEDLRANRQPEFTQLDLEMSFVEQEDVLAVCESLFTQLTESLSDKKILSKPWPRITWQDAMDRYGSDKPDLRYDLPIVDVSDIVAHSPFQVFSGAIERGGVVRGIRAPDGAGFTRRQIDELTELAKANGARGLAWAAHMAGEVRSSFVRNLGPGEPERLWSRLEASDGDLVLLVADSVDVARSSLGALRRELAQRLELIPDNVMAWAFVVEFPWFEKDEASGRLTFMHHPFTMPFDDDLPLARNRSSPRAGKSLRRGRQRRGAGQRQHPRPPRRHSGASVRAARLFARAHPVQLRPHAARIPVRRPATRRHRAWHRPRGQHARRRGQHPRGHPFPQKPERSGPDDGCADGRAGRTTCRPAHPRR